MQAYSQARDVSNMSPYPQSHTSFVALPDLPNELSLSSTVYQRKTRRLFMFGGHGSDECWLYNTEKSGESGNASYVDLPSFPKNIKPFGSGQSIPLNSDCSEIVCIGQCDDFSHYFLIFDTAKNSFQTLVKMKPINLSLGFVAIRIHNNIMFTGMNGTDILSIQSISDMRWITHNNRQRFCCHGSVYICGLNIVVSFGGLNAVGQCYILDLNRKNGKDSNAAENAIKNVDWKAVKYGRMPVDMYGFGWVTIADRYIVTFGGIDAMSPDATVSILICDTHALYRSHLNGERVSNIWIQSNLTVPFSGFGMTAVLCDDFIHIYGGTDYSRENTLKKHWKIAVDRLIKGPFDSNVIQWMRKECCNRDTFWNSIPNDVCGVIRMFSGGVFTTNCHS